MYLDIVIGVILVFTIVMGIRNGFLISILSLFGVVINIVGAKMLTPIVIDALNIQGEGLLYLGTYMGVFGLVYMVITLLLSFLKSFIKENLRNPIDVTFGMIFGGAKGLLISFIVLLLFNILNGHIKTLEKYGENSISNKAFIKALPYVREWMPSRVGDTLDKSKYKAEIEKFLKIEDKE